MKQRLEHGIVGELSFPSAGSADVLAAVSREREKKSEVNSDSCQSRSESFLTDIRPRLSNFCSLGRS